MIGLLYDLNTVVKAIYVKGGENFDMDKWFLVLSFFNLFIVGFKLERYNATATTKFLIKDEPENKIDRYKYGRYYRFCDTYDILYDTLVRKCEVFCYIVNK